MSFLHTYRNFIAYIENVITYIKNVITYIGKCHITYKEMSLVNIEKIYYTHRNVILLHVH